jgi:CRISPR-associated protein Cas2
MPHDSQWWLVCYDVRDPKRLYRAAKHLEGYGHRMQYSVFRCWLSQRQMECLRWELTEILDSEDDLLMIPLCARCVEGLTTTHSTKKEPAWPEKPASHRVV